MYLLMAILVLFAGIGHLAIWTRLHSFIHALPYRQWLIDIGEYSTYLMSLLLPALFLAWWMMQPQRAALETGNGTETTTLYYLWYAYGVVCILAFVAACLLWLFYWSESHAAANYFREQLVERLVFDNEADQLLAKKSVRTAHKFPGNQILRMEVNRKELLLRRLPEQLDGLTITHISDLHLKGHMAEAFYHKIVDQVNDLQSDLIVISGDIFDRDQCFPWSARTLSRLSAPCGVYFILGNHENRTSDPELARKTLIDDGLISLGGRHRTLMIRDYPVLLAGNELPWHPPAADMSTVDPASYDQPPFKLLVAHTPDQFGWACTHDFDLMLAGHVHGGQIRLPGLGPIVSPSIYGTRYACGVFYSTPTMMHVSRGISGTTPLRIYCSPEITQLVLRQAK
ncbi:metallophosphoesterase [Blastopirellula marina]|uniref:Calcineurin-like phosphoesterase domain-containing protein n=1 Tax=Blastopirellula marina TaxID=124 RepID=A0A2S8GJ93_9BACT|nr:metallophosphoesterase [Blastopirellula marina]PQO44496.1 hypothetical protein C5Y93_18980 [Blastopirellula marina]